MALKPLVFEILLALSDNQPGEGRHGWDLVREIRDRGGFTDIMPGNFYRTLRGLLDDGLIDEVAGRRRGPEDERRRYFRLTAAGRQAAGVEARRLQALVLESRARKLLTRKG
jgi:DNA-binding PadR family transcriptional regulator